MSGKVRVNYNAVYSKTAQSRAAIRNQLNATNQNYNQLLNSVKTMDSSTNNALIEAIERSRVKASVTAKILEKELSFIDGSTMQVELQENKIAQRFSRIESRRI